MEPVQDKVRPRSFQQQFSCPDHLVPLDEAFTLILTAFSSIPLINGNIVWSRGQSEPIQALSGSSPYRPMADL